MAIFQNIRERLGNFFLNKELKKIVRQPHAVNLLEAQTVGILFDSSNAEDYDLVIKYVNYLKEMKKKVKAIGFFSSSYQPPKTHSKLEYDFFTKKDLNFFMKPVDPFINNFIEEQPDILIDLNLYNRLPLRFIAARSKAKFKIGVYDMDNKDLYDLMIETDDSKSFKYFLRNVDTYLLMINKK